MINDRIELKIIILFLIKMDSTFFDSLPEELIFIIIDYINILRRKDFSDIMIISDDYDKYFYIISPLISVLENKERYENSYFDLLTYKYIDEFIYYGYNRICHTLEILNYIFFKEDLVYFL